MTAVLAFLIALQTPPTYIGRQKQVDVAIPRIEVEIAVDGALTDSVWQRAALLTGFSQYRPVDGRAAEDSTQVLVWYNSGSVHFGIRAFEAHGTVKASLADRDRIDGEDYVQILLDPFNDRRRAWIFGINPLGVQADGIRTEGGTGASGPGAGGRFENVDLNPDFVFASKGRVTDYGYEVEIRVPFKSLRYQSVDPQTWALNVLRKVQHSGYEDTWTPALRANASFLAQSGSLVGMTQLRRGLVLDVNPFTTLKTTGSAELPADRWSYRTTSEAGLNARWGVSANLTLDATINPDFSQVEADAGQVTVNERFAVFFAEKRPFFLEGIDNFNTPNQLIYTRQIVSPEAGVKLTGKVGATNVAYLAAVDDASFSNSGDDHPIFNLLRVRSDVGAQSTVGLAYTDRTEGGNYSRVASADARIVFGKLYFAQLQAASSFTRENGASLRGPLWEATVDRTGRRWGFHYTLRGVDPEFRTRAGFVSRTGIVNPSIFNRFSTYGAPGALLESTTTFVSMNGNWQYDEFFDAHAPLETSVSTQSILTLRGGWSITLNPSWITTAFDPDFYADYAVQRSAGSQTDTVPFTVPGRLTDVFAFGVSASTPQFPRFYASASINSGHEVAFFEPSRVRRLAASTTMLWRPTERVRAEASYSYLALTRPRDGSRFSTANIPRVKLEYQLSRPLFVRFVGQYRSQERAALRDPSTGEPILVRDASTNEFVLSSTTASNDLRTDWLLSYRPVPGTVLFAGYGSGFTGTEGYALRGLDRTEDGFFFKVSYLFRM